MYEIWGLMYKIAPKSDFHTTNGILSSNKIRPDENFCDVFRIISKQNSNSAPQGQKPVSLGQRPRAISAQNNAL